MDIVNGISTEKFDTDECPGIYLTSFQRKLLEKSWQNPNLPQQYRQRLQIMLLADEGKSQAEICQLVGCCHGTARHWILMARTGQAHNWQEQAVGRPKAINEQYLERLKELVSQSPKDCGYSFNRWTAKWLSNHLAKELGIEVSARHINRLLKQMGLSTRPQLQTEQNSTLKPEGKRILSKVKNEFATDDLSSNPSDETRQLWSQIQTFNHR